MKRSHLLLHALAASFFLYLGPVHAASIRVAYSAISGAMAPLWTTQEGGYFHREGLDIELPYIGGGTLLIQSMLGGDVQFAYGPSVPVVNSALRGSDLVFIANTGDTLIYSVMTKPEIKDPMDLKDKKVGVTRIGGSADLALDYALKKWGLQRGRDVVVLQTGGLPESLAALRSGVVQGAVLSPPNNLLAKKAGLREMVDIGQLGIIFPNTALSTTRSYLKSNRDVVIRLLRALGEGQHRLRNDKEFSMKVLAKYTKTTDPEVLSELYQIYGVRYTGQQIPYVRLEGVDEILKGIESKEARQAKPADFVDNGLLKEVEQAGFFQKLYRRQHCGCRHMKIVVTGGAGRLGQYVIKESAERGHEVSCLDTVSPAETIRPSLSVDLRDTIELIKALEGADAVIHLARVRFPYTSKSPDPVSGCWKTPDVAGDAARFSHNVTITYNVLAASLEAGVKKIVCGSSLAIYGLYYPLRSDSPDYLPIDEDHPLRPQDPYGISKVVGENLCDSFARTREIQIASLRFAGIAAEAQYPTLLKRSKDPLCRGTGALWTYIDARDAAAACRLAVEKDFFGHKTFNICARKTIMKEDTLELVKRFLPRVKLAKQGLEGNWSGYDPSRAETVLGFRAVHLLEN